MNRFELTQPLALHFSQTNNFFIKKYILSIVRSALKEKDLLDTIFIGLKISQGIWPCPFWNIMKEEWCSRDPLLMKYPFPLLLKKKDILNGILTSMKISQGIWGYPFWNKMKEERCSRNPLLIKYPFPLLLWGQQVERLLFLHRCCTPVYSTSHSTV